MSPALSPTQTPVSALSITILVTGVVRDTESSVSPVVMEYILTVMSRLEDTTRAECAGP